MIFESAIFDSRGTFSESLYFFENSNSRTNFRNGSNSFRHCRETFGMVAQTIYSTYAEEKFQEDEINWSKFKFTIKFKKWENYFSQCYQNCIVHVQTGILRKIKSFEKLKFAVNSKVKKKVFLASSSNLHISSPDKSLRQN